MSLRWDGCSGGGGMTMLLIMFAVRGRQVVRRLGERKSRGDIAQLTKREGGGGREEDRREKLKSKK